MGWGRVTCAVGLGLVLFGPGAFGEAGRPDRLERFRELALSRPRLLTRDGDVPADVYREMYALLDAEVLENLATGGPFASTAFLEERLDALGGAWGAASLRVVRVGRLVVGAFQLSDTSDVNTVRVYGRRGDAPGLLMTLGREGRPSVYPLPPARGGAPQVLAAWEGVPSGVGTRALRLDLLRQEGDGVRVAWTTADAFTGGLVARAYEVRGGEGRVRYELHYAGWTAGCAGQTEAEDLFRLAADASRFTRVGRTYHDAWHRSFRESASRLFEAIAARDDVGLSKLVPDGDVRRRLPALLRPEPACGAPDRGPLPRTVSVAASDGRRPWAVVFGRSADGWRLLRAAPVLE